MELNEVIGHNREVFGSGAGQTHVGNSCAWGGAEKPDLRFTGRKPEGKGRKTQLDVVVQRQDDSIACEL